MESTTTSLPLGVRKGAWTEEEDHRLRDCIDKHGEGKWYQVPLRAGLNRCRKSCRLRWLNYLKPNIKRGNFSADEVDMMMRLHKLLGNRWSLIAGRLPGRTSNDVKNYWNTHLLKKLITSRTQKENAKALVAKQTKIYRPQPQTFSKNLPSSWNKTTIKADNVQPKDRTTAPSPGIEMGVNNKIMWPSMSDSLAEKVGVFEVWNERMALGSEAGGVGGESYVQESQYDWNDIFNTDSMDLWDLKGDTHQQALI